MATSTSLGTLWPGMDTEDWSTAGEPDAKGSLAGWVVFLGLVVLLLVVEVTVGFFGGPSIAEHSTAELAIPVAVGLLVAFLYVLAWRDERFRPPHGEGGRLGTMAAIGFILAYFATINYGIATPVQLWLLITAAIAVVVAGRTYHVFAA